MFENYTNEARMTIFFAKYEASWFKGEEVEPLHLLLGILRAHAKSNGHFFVLKKEEIARLQSGFEKYFFEAALRIAPEQRCSEKRFSPRVRHVLGSASDTASAHSSLISSNFLLLALLISETALPQEIQEMLKGNGITHSVVLQRIKNFPARNYRGPFTLSEPCLIHIGNMEPRYAPSVHQAEMWLDHNGFVFCEDGIWRVDQKMSMIDSQTKEALECDGFAARIEKLKLLANIQTCPVET